MSETFPLTIDVKTQEHTQFVNITDKVRRVLPKEFTGACLLFCQHTTAGLTINENADPNVVRDMIAHLEEMVPWRSSKFRHMEGNSAAHIKSSLMGPGLTVPVHKGKLMLGTWQSIYFCEFDGPRSRLVTVQLLPAYA